MAMIDERNLSVKTVKIKLFRNITSLLLLLFGILICPVTAVASSYQEYDGLQVTVTTDKEVYEEGEQITAMITVTNVDSKTITVLNLEQLIPEGYVLSENSAVSTKNVEIKPGQDIQLQVTFEGDPQADGENGEGTFWDKVFYGETIGIPNIILIVFGVIFFIVFMALT